MKDPHSTMLLCPGLGLTEREDRFKFKEEGVRALRSIPMCLRMPGSVYMCMSLDLLVVCLWVCVCVCVFH